MYHFKGECSHKRATTSSKCLYQVDCGIMNRKTSQVCVISHCLDAVLPTYVTCRYAAVSMCDRVMEPFTLIVADCGRCLASLLKKIMGDIAMKICISTRRFFLCLQNMNLNPLLFEPKYSGHTTQN